MPVPTSMRLRRRLLIPLIVLLVVASVGVLVALRRQAPPEAARLLPGADGFFYVNLKWIRTFNATSQLPPISREPEYQKFVDETGFQFERDLDEAAFAIHYPKSWLGKSLNGESLGTNPSSNSGGSNSGGPSSTISGSPAPSHADSPASPTASGPTFTEPRFSEVFVGRIDTARLTTYLKTIASSIDSYRGFDIYNVPLEGRTLRIVTLTYDSVAVSNHPDPAVIHGMIDRSRRLASPFGGPWLLRRFYRKVPLASLAFAILRVRPEMRSPAGPASDSFTGLGGWSLLFPKPAVAVISARYLRALHLRAEAFATDEASAQAITEKTAAFLSLFHAAEGSVGNHGTDPDVKTFFDSLKVEQAGDRAILTATVPPGFMKKVLAEPPAEADRPKASPEAARTAKPPTSKPK